MSTRGCVAVGNEKEYKGVYNHWDSYPSGLGKDVWDMIQERGIREVAEGILQYGDWREYVNIGVCEYCGKKVGQPHSISIFGVGDRDTKEKIEKYWRGMPWAAEKPDQVEDSIKGDLKMLDNIAKTGYPDPEAKRHSHGKGAKDQMTEKNADPLFIEWVYILDPERGTIIVLCHRSDDVTSGEIRGEPIVRKDGYTDYGHCAYRHIKLCELSVNGKEPEWDNITEDMGSKGILELVGEDGELIPSLS